MRVVYIAGPFRADTEYGRRKNIAVAEALALRVWRAGCAALCPHLNSAHFQDAGPDKVLLEGGLELLRRCDAVIVTENYARSDGTLAEMELAHSLGLPVFNESRFAVFEEWASAKDKPDAP